MINKLIRTDRAAAFGLLGVIIVSSDLYIHDPVWAKLRLVSGGIAVGLAMYFASKDRKFKDEKMTIIMGTSVFLLIVLAVIYMVFKFDLK